MPNILINPSSGILEFNTGIAGGSVFDTSLSGAARLTFNSGEINLVSYSTGVTDRFTVDGAAGRLFSVSDALTGSIFSVNDIAGLPLIEVVSTTGDTITIGPYNTNTLVVKDTRVGIGTGIPSSKLQIVDTTSGSISPVLHLEETWNTTGIGTGIYLNITDSGANSASSLLNARINNSNIFSVRKDGMVIVPSTVGIQSLSNTNTKFVMAGDQWGIYLNGSGPSFFTSVNPTTWTVGVNGGFAWSQGSYANDTRDIYLMRDAAGIIAQRNGANAQTYRVYNTYTNSNNFELGKIGWNSNVFEIGTEKGATGGLPRNLSLITSGQPRLTVTSDGRVGIGSTNPSNKLDVVGSAYVSEGFQAANQTLIVEVGNVLMLDPVVDQNSFDLNNGINFKLLGNSGAQIELYNNSLISGFNNISATNIYKGGYSVLTTNDTGSFAVDTSKVVYTTGNQTINGEKTLINNLNLESGIKFNGGISSGNLEIYKNDKTYNFSVGPTGTWGNFGSTLISLTSGGPNINNNFTPSFKLLDQSNLMFFEIGGYSDDAQYGAYSTFRMGSDGLAYWGANGGVFAIRGANIGIGTDLPNHKLDVDGNVNANGNVNATSFSSSGNPGLTTSVSVIDNSNNVITLNFENGLLISIT